MRYKPKSIAALHVALGGLPDKMRVEVDPGIQPSPQTVVRTSEDDRVAREFGHNNSAGTRFQQRCKGEQGERSDSHCAEIVGRRHHRAPGYAGPSPAPIELRPK